MRIRLPGLAATAILSASACVTTFHEGHDRPLSEGAMLSSKDTVVDEIDGKDVQGLRESQSQYVLPPGPHVIGFSLKVITPGFFGNTIRTSDFLRVCFVAYRGHRYLTAADMGSRSWRPVIFDQFSGVTEDSRPGVPVLTDCRSDRLFPRSAPATPAPTAMIPSPAALATAPESGAASAPSSLAPGSSEPAAAPGEPEQQPEVQPSAPPPIRAVPATIRLWSGETIERRQANPFFDLFLSSGYALGGDNILTARLSNGDTQTLNGGQGLFLNVGALLTPLWVGRLGMGAGVEIGVKYDDVAASNARISFTRYPGIATLHALVRANDRWFVLMQGGVEKDLGVSLSGSGDASDVNASLTSRVGGLGRLGMYYRSSDLLAFAFGIAYTHLAYDAPGGSLDANSFGFWANVHLSL